MARYQTVGIDNFAVGDEEIIGEGRGTLSIVPTKRRL